MSFSRHKEIYRSDGGFSKAGEQQLSPLPSLIGCDEFPVGYSLAGCPPAEPASASPTGNDSQLPYNDFSANGNNPLNSVSQPKGALQKIRTPQGARSEGARVVGRGGGVERGVGILVVSVIA